MDKSKLFFFTNCDIKDSAFGGALAARSRYELMSRMFETECYCCLKQSNVKSALSVLQRVYPPLRNSIIKKTVKKCRDRKSDAVFLDDFCFEKLAKSLKSSLPDIKIVT